VVDGHGDEASRRRAAITPGSQKQKKRQRIAAARNRDDGCLAPFEAEAFEGRCVGR
jgi:hypothetical protein